MKGELSIKHYALLGVMAIGAISLTAGADLASNSTTGIILAILGGIAVTISGIWLFRTAEKEKGYDERYLKISLRGGTISLWAFYWAAISLDSIQGNTELTTPVLDPLTWLITVPFIVFPCVTWYYSKVM